MMFLCVHFCFCTLSVAILCHFSSKFALSNLWVQIWERDLHILLGPETRTSLIQLCLTNKCTGVDTTGPLWVTCCVCDIACLLCSCYCMLDPKMYVRRHIFVSMSFVCVIYYTYNSRWLLPSSTVLISSLHFSWCSGCLARRYKVQDIPVNKDDLFYLKPAGTLYLEPTSTHRRHTLSRATSTHRWQWCHVLQTWKCPPHSWCPDQTGHTHLHPMRIITPWKLTADVFSPLFKCVVWVAMEVFTQALYVRCWKWWTAAGTCTNLHQS